MINNCTKIFTVPATIGFERDSNTNGYEPDAPFLTELGHADEGNYKTYMLQKAKDLLKVFYIFRILIDYFNEILIILSFVI